METPVTDESREYSRQWDKANPEKVKAIKERWRQNNLERDKEQRRKASERYRAKLRAAAGEGPRHGYYLKLKDAGYYEKIKAKAKTWRESHRHPCVDCGKPVSKDSTRCPVCAGIRRRSALRGRKYARKERLIVDPGQNCPYCETQMRQTEWHSRKFWRCGGCGLEFEKPPPYMEEAA